MKGIGRKVYVLIGFVISFICLFLAFRKVQWTQVASILANLHYFWLIMSIFFQLIYLAIAGFRWKLVINLPEVSWRSAVGAMSVGLMVNNILPGRLGEFARAILLGQETRTNKGFLFATVVIDRMFDLIVLVTLGLLSTGGNPTIPWVREIRMTGSLALFFAISIIILFARTRIGLRIEGIFREILPIPLSEKMGNLIQEFRLGLRSVKSAKKGTIIFGFSCLVWTVWSISLYCGLHSFGLTIPFWGLILLLSVLNLGGLIPSSPGYMGTYHLLIVATLAIFGIKKEDALSFALVFHALWFMPQTLIGFIILTRKNFSLWRLMKPQRWRVTSLTPIK